MTKCVETEECSKIERVSGLLRKKIKYKTGFSGWLGAWVEVMAGWVCLRWEGWVSGGVGRWRGGWVERWGSKLQNQHDANDQQCCLPHLPGTTGCLIFARSSRMRLGFRYEAITSSQPQ